MPTAWQPTNHGGVCPTVPFTYLLVGHGSLRQTGDNVAMSSFAIVRPQTNSILKWKDSIIFVVRPNSAFCVYRGLINNKILATVESRTICQIVVQIQQSVRCVSVVCCSLCKIQLLYSDIFTTNLYSVTRKECSVFHIYRFAQFGDDRQ